MEGEVAETVVYQLLMSADTEWPLCCLMELTVLCELCSVVSAARPPLLQTPLNWSLSPRPPLPVYILERERETDTDGSYQAALAACWAALCCCCLLNSLD